jgi:hypothetical protein
MTAMDARLDNWCYVVPPAMRTLLLPAVDETSADVVVEERTMAALNAALTQGSHDAVAVPDLSSWASQLMIPAARLLARLATSVPRGGWIFIGIAPLLCPLEPLRPGRLSAARARHVLEQAGLVAERTWLVLPSLRRPAFFVPADRRDEFDYFLTTVFFPHVESRSAVIGRSTRTMLRLGRRLALSLPASVRVTSAPGVALLGVRQ